MPIQHTLAARARPNPACSHRVARNARGRLHFALLFFLPFASPAATPPGTLITNRAQVVLTAPDGAPQVFSSNFDRFEVLPPTAPSTTAQAGFYRVDQSGEIEGGWTPANYRDAAGAFCALPNVSAAMLAAGPVPTRFVEAGCSHPNDLIQLRVVNPGANLRAGEIDRVAVRVSSAAGETEDFQLSETGLDTGVFAGVVQIGPAGPSTAFDGRLSAPAHTTLSLTYVCGTDTRVRAAAGILIDPFGTVFDSSTGEPVSGVVVTLIDDATGQPATVFGIDGASRFPSTVVTGEDIRDGGGTIYKLARGAYVFPLVRPGRYRYAVRLGPGTGFTYPSTATADQLARLPGAPFAIIPASTGGTFDVVLDPVMCDLPLDAVSTATTLALSLTTPAIAAGLGDLVRYNLELTSQRGLLPFRNVTLSNRLPPGFRLDPGSLRLDGAPLAAAPSRDGSAFAVIVPEIEGGQTVRVSYLARVVNGRGSRAVATAVATAGAFRSAEAAASVVLQDDLMSSQAHLLGRVARCENGQPTGDGLANIALFLETGAMVVTDERGFFHFEGLAPGTHVVQLDTTTLPAGARPILPNDSAESAGRSWSRFADVAAGSLWTADFDVEMPPAAATGSAATAAPVHPAAVVYDQTWIDDETPACEWLLPTADTPLPTPSVKLLVKHLPAHTVKAFLDGEPVNSINFEGTLRSNRHPLAASLWRGVVLHDGDNKLEIVREDSFGIERGRETRIIRYASPPVRAELVETASRLIADGLSPPVLAVRLFDRDDHPARAGITGRFAVRPPFAAWREAKTDLRLAPGALAEATQFTVGEGGLALVKLEPVTESGTVHLVLDLAGGSQEIRADLHGDRRDWLVVGLAEGTPAWSTVNGHLENATADDIANGFDAAGRVAFFAKGRIKGGWLLTAACDSAKEKKPDPASLHGLIDPDAFYTVYGDASTRHSPAPSTGKLYVKLERKAVVALCGDFSLDWSSNSFTTYSRELHGAKVDYRGEKIRASVFQSDAGLTHGRDEFRGSGLSGPYALKARPIVAFSERLVVQERDRLQPDRIVAETPLTRNVDYAIDSAAGSVRLSQPLFPSSPALNPVYLVVHYELEDQTAGVVLGARIESTPNDHVRVGISSVRQEHDGRADTSTGIDAHVQLTKHLGVTAAVARSDNANGPAHAYRAEVAHETETSQAQAYVVEVGAGFGLNQLGEQQLGSRQIVVAASQRLATTLNARELLSVETVQATGDRREAGEAQLEWTRDEWNLRSGLRSARDARAGATDTSNLLTAGVSRRFFHDRLELRADREQSIAGEANNLDFPARTVLGAKFALTSRTALTAEQEWTEARGRRTAATRLGTTTIPWAGAALTGSAVRSAGAFPATALGGGLHQTLKLTPHLTVEGGFQRTAVVSGTADSAGAAGGNGFSMSPLHSAGGFSSASEGDSSSIFAGVHWQPGDVLYNARAEFNELMGTRRSIFLASAQSEPARDLGLLASVISSVQSSATAGSSLTLDARFGAAWRPRVGRTIVLQRLDLIHVPGSGDDSASVWKVVENIHLNRRLGTRWQLSTHLGAKYVLAGSAPGSLTTLGAAETRFDLPRGWDVGVQSATLSNWRSATHRWSAGVSLGRTVAKNLWVSVGYNFRGFADADFTAARYTAPGVNLRFRLKFDQESLAGLINAIKAE